MPKNYSDILLGYSYFGNYLKAIRISKNYDKIQRNEIINLFKCDASIKNVNIYRIDASSSIISMNVGKDNTFLDKLIKLYIFPLKSSVHNNIEEYIFMFENAKIKTLISSLKNEDIKIINIHELRPDEIISTIGNFIMDIFLTQRERNIIKIAIENNFFDIPRGTTNQELADKFNISKMAFNLEIRRATNKIISRMYLK